MGYLDSRRSAAHWQRICKLQQVSRLASYKFRELGPFGAIKTQPQLSLLHRSPRPPWYEGFEQECV